MFIFMVECVWAVMACVYVSKISELENDEKVNLIGSKKFFNRELVFQF